MKKKIVPWLKNTAKLLWAIYLLITSLYCVLAIPPYTYYAFIKAPPYDWIIWFVQYHVLLYWSALACALVAYWPGYKSRFYVFSGAISVLMGAFITVRPFMKSVRSDEATLGYALVSLVPLLLWAAVEISSSWPDEVLPELKQFAYTGPVVSAVVVAGLSAAALYWRRSAPVTPDQPLDDIQMAGFSTISHVALALVIVSVLNLVRLGAGRIRHGWAVAHVVAFTLIAGWLAQSTFSFLQNSLSFPRVAAIGYAVLLSLAVTLFAFSLMLPALKRAASKPDLGGRSRTWTIVTLAVAVLLGLTVPPFIATSDWNGVMQRMFMCALWVALVACFSRLVGRHRQYSLAAVLGVIAIAGSAYAGVKSTAILWGNTLGDTEDDISRSMQQYASRDASFALVHDLLGNTANVRPCGELCHVLEQYTNIPEAHLAKQIDLVESPWHKVQHRPNIFMFVIDSMRPDYIGAYNSKADFTPNLDALARDSIVFRNAYTQYSGTTLSEPAIWSGTMLLHSHYVQPFSHVNNLEKLVRADGYKMIVSYDTVLSQVLDPSDDMVRLDGDKSVWKKFELCSTVDELTRTLDARTDKSQPVFFYSQPMNVHQLAQRNRPASAFSGWNHPGFHARISMEVHEVDACLGGFVSYLKQRHLYDDSIVIVTSDHGDATGELGRASHALIIYPEIMRVPLIMHLPKAMQQQFVFDEKALAALTDITPSLDFLLGHRPLRHDPVLGHSLFAQTRQELERDARHELFMASDVLPVFGILAENGRFLYTTYASPPKSELFDLVQDPNAQHNVLTPELKREYDQRVIDYLKQVGDFFGYKPGVVSFLASERSGR